MPGPEHEALVATTLLFCREVWDCPIVGVEPQGPGRFHDIVALRLARNRGLKPGIVALEIKASRNDFLLGIKNKQFSFTKYIHEMWLVYTGSFNIDELPKHVGILTPKKRPVCLNHSLSKKDEICIATCKEPKLVHFNIVRKAQINPLDYKVVWNAKYDWTWAISRKSTTDFFNLISRNF